MKISKPIRMCLSCRERNAQSSMVRLQQNANQVIVYQGQGRSFYLCHTCINTQKKTKGLAKRFQQDEERFTKFLKELIKHG